MSGSAPEAETGSVSLMTILGCWGRIGCLGFGGPPAHLALLRRLCVDDRGWLSPQDFEDGIAATSLLPGPASTQMAIWCAWRLRRAVGAVVGGLAFIVPGLVIILGLSALFLASRPPRWVLGAAAGAGAAVAAVAINAAMGLLPASWSRARQVPGPATAVRWVAYLLAGGIAAGLAGSWLVLVLLVCGLLELALRYRPPPVPPGRLQGLGAPLLAAPAAAAVATGGLAALVWVAFKVGALSFGGGFVIIPLMQHDAVNHYHWMTSAQFLNAVALGQITPGPVVLTTAVIGYAAAGVGGGLLAVLVAFSPSFGFVIGGGRYFDRVRTSRTAQAFLAGAGPAAIGAIAGAAVPLAAALHHLWQGGVLAAAAVWLLALRRSVPLCLLAAALIGVAAALLGAPVAR
ncbi:MAG TPA: chromate efflux transporter [Acidimicrobiales bacterium]|jgi:chromate transporter|nr:chromate efflux transporter [Acidimicrobiales bacterium]